MRGALSKFAWVVDPANSPASVVRSHLPIVSFHLSHVSSFIFSHMKIPRSLLSVSQMTLQDARSNQDGSDNMTQTTAVTRSDLVLVVHTLEANTQLCSILAEHLGEDEAEGLQDWNETVSGLASDLRAKMGAQEGLQKVLPHNRQP